jgi:hypothetical protein
LVSIWTIPVG